MKLACGRLDSTNIITPELTVITNIGRDHINLLGDSLEKIAVEKAGIIKTNVPVVIGEMLPKAKIIFEKIATEKNAPFHLATQERNVAVGNGKTIELMLSCRRGKDRSQKISS